MNGASDWRAIYDLWFPPGLDGADAATHGQMFDWWFGGGSNAELPPFAPVIEAARPAGKPAGSTRLSDACR
jgi:hypothetical protein